MLARLSMAKLFTLFVAGFVLLRGLIRSSEPMMLGTLLMCLAGVLLMIWASDWVAQHILPWARMGAFASDFDEAASQGPVIAIMGWALLLLMLAMVLFWGPAEEPALLEGLIRACDRPA